MLTYPTRLQIWSFQVIVSWRTLNECVKMRKKKARVGRAEIIGLCVCVCFVLFFFTVAVVVAKGPYDIAYHLCTP